MKNYLFKLTCGLALISTSHLVQAQSLVFTSNSGSAPYSMTLSSSVDFTITNSSLSGNFIVFLIENLYPDNNVGQHVIDSTHFTSDIQYAINGGSLHNINAWVDGGYPGNPIPVNDGFIWDTLGQNLNLGDVVTLYAGTISTLGFGTPSGFHVGTSGNYNMIIDSGTGGSDMFPISGLAVTATPEPSTLALAALGGASLLLFRRRK